MSNGSKYGYRGSFRFLGGISSGFFIVLLLCAMINLILINILPTIGIWLKIFGAAYMVALAIYIATSNPAKEAQPNSKSKRFATGFALQFVNLKTILYAITVFSVFIIPNYRDWYILTGFSTIFAITGFTAASCWALFGAAMEKAPTKYKRIANLLMGALLIYTAISVFFE